MWYVLLLNFSGKKLLTPLKENFIRYKNYSYNNNVLHYLLNHNAWAQIQHTNHTCSENLVQSQPFHRNSKPKCIAAMKKTLYHCSLCSQDVQSQIPQNSACLSN